MTSDRQAGMAARLAQSELFCDLEPRTRTALAAATRWRELAASELLFSQGTERTAMYLLVDGELEILVELHGVDDLVAVLGPGEEVSENALLGPAMHSSSARARTELTVLELSGEKAWRALEHDARGAMQVLSRVGERISRRLQFAAPRQLAVERVHHPLIRAEHDLLGDREVPGDALYGIQTLRAVENFPISGIRLSHFPGFIRALAMVKQAAARVNRELGMLDAPIAAAIDAACQEVIDGRWHGHFVVDMVQGGAGTSTNMNANEVIANRALELLDRPRGAYDVCHPNNHVNLSQSTNDVYPTALRVALVFGLEQLLTALSQLHRALAEKGDETSTVLKMGRTQLQDAVPMTLGQEFHAMALTISEDISRLRETARLFLEINIGGTAIGTGINADPEYATKMVSELSQVTGLELQLAENLVEATPDTGSFVMFSGALKRVAIKLSKMCNDLRLLSSGPRCGLGEIDLPAMQPGSSIMPGKVNPVIPEVVNQVAFQIIGNDLTITMAAEAGQLQLNAMEPIIAFNLLSSLEMLPAALNTLVTRCINGIRPNVARCRELVEHSIGIVTAVVPALGYERTSEVAKKALQTGKPVRQILIEGGYLTAEQVDELLSLETMTAPRRLRR